MAFDQAIADEICARIAQGETLRACIYGLYDSSGSLRYIGKANDPDARMKSHMRDARRKRTPLYDWIRRYGKPEMRVIEENCEDWAASERMHIEQARARGERLLNLAPGGDEPFCSDEQRSKNGNVLSERLRSDPVFYFNRKFLTMVGRLAKTFSTSDPEKARRLKSRQETWAAMSIDDPDRLFQSYIRDNRIRSRLGILDEWIIYE